MFQMLYDNKKPETLSFGGVILQKENRITIICLIFFHPDYTVGPGIKPDHAIRLAGYTADRDLHSMLPYDVHPFPEDQYLIKKFLLNRIFIYDL